MINLLSIITLLIAPAQTTSDKGSTNYPVIIPILIVLLCVMLIVCVVVISLLFKSKNEHKNISPHPNGCFSDLSDSEKDLINTFREIGKHKGEDTQQEIIENLEKMLK